MFTSKRSYLQWKDFLSEVQQSHPSDPGKTESTKLKLEFISKAKDFRGSKGQLIINGIALSSPNCCMAIGRLESLTRFIQHHVTQGRPKDSVLLDELVMEGDWEKTEDGEPFVLYDNADSYVDDGPGRIIMFATDRCLRLLSRAGIWYMDGTLLLLYHISNSSFFG